jgi:hypothetical protein
MDAAKLTTDDVRLALVVEGAKYEGEVVALGERVPLTSLNYRTQVMPLLEKHMNEFNTWMKEKKGGAPSYDETIAILLYVGWMLGIDE